MYSHTDIWNAIDRLAGSFGYSPSGLAKKAGLDPTTFNKSKRVSTDGKPRWPSTESIAKILSVTGMTMSEFFSMAETNGGKEAPLATIPLLSVAQAQRAGTFDEAGFPQGQGWDRIALPFTDKDRQALYALKIAGSAANALYREGDVIIAAPGAVPRRGERAVIRTMDGTILTGELARQSGGRIELSTSGPNGEKLAFSSGDVQWTARILWASQ